jgi:hypothetical protein
MIRQAPIRVIISAGTKLPGPVPKNARAPPQERRADHEEDSRREERSLANAARSLAPHRAKTAEPRPEQDESHPREQRELRSGGRRQIGRSKRRQERVQSMVQTNGVASTAAAARAIVKTMNTRRDRATSTSNWMRMK